MIKILFFLWKYKILKDPANLSYQTKNFFKLPEKSQNKILDRYFETFATTKGLETYYNDKSSRYYENGREITFFHSYYFDKLLLEYNIKSIILIDEFKIEAPKKESLIQNTLEKLKNKQENLTSKDIVTYPDDLPISLSKHLDFMTYLVNADESNIKYIVYNDTCSTKQRELIKRGIEIASTKDFNLKKFLKNDGSLPKILEKNLDFLLYLIENNIENIDYLEEKLIENTTISNRKLIVETIVKSLNKNPNYLEKLEKNITLANILNEEEDFITYITNQNIDNIKYINWHILNDSKKERIINLITKKIEAENIDFDIMKYPFHDLFFQNINFMNYLMKKDFRWLTITKINSKEENDKLINLFFDTIKTKHYKFHLEDFLEDGTYFNHRLIENEKMLHYFFNNKVQVIKHIDFFNVTSTKYVVENILKEIESKDFEFSNEDFLVNGKYPIPLSNSYRFMRYVIDKNFNNIAYIDISMIDKRELKRIINYAFRMVYYIRGENKNLNFDIEGYFKDSDIIKDEYFKECLESL